MSIEIIGNEKLKIAVVESQDIVIGNTQDALDLIATINHLHDCNKIIINKQSIIDSFFELKTGVAGDILQKFTNYQTKIAIVGVFECYNSKSLKDFIFESNKGTQVFFLPTKEAAVSKLNNI